MVTAVTGPIDAPMRQVYNLLDRIQCGAAIQDSCGACPARSADSSNSATLRRSALPGKCRPGEVSVKKPCLVLVTILTAVLWIVASPAHATLVKACEVENPPANCETMWAVIAHVRLPRQPIAAFDPPPRCQSDYNIINWGKIVADALEAEGDPATLENLAMDVSDAFQNKSIPQITRHFRGETSTLIESNFSKLTPKAWRPSAPPNDETLCAPVIATVPASATVREFRFQASDEALGQMDCTEGKVCPIGYSRFAHGCGSGPQITWNNRVTVYVTVFQNWSTDWAREGRMIIFFEMPAGRVPVEHPQDATTAARRMP